MRLGVALYVRRGDTRGWRTPLGGLPDEARRESTVDRFPLGEQEAERLSGATAKPMARPEISDAVAESLKVHSVDSKTSSRKAAPPPLFRVLAELEVTRRALEDARPASASSAAQFSNASQWRPRTC